MTGKINIEKLAALKLGHGSGGPDYCVMEAISILTGEQRTDKPACVAPSLIALGIRLNDWATDEQRQTLKAFVPRVIGTAGDDAAEERRKYLCIDAAVREFAPLWLERAGLTEWADLLRALPTIVDKDGAAASASYASSASAAAYAGAATSYAATSYAATSYAAASAASASYASYASAAASAASAAAASAAAYAVAATSYTAASASASYAVAAAEMGMWERCRDLYDRMIRVGETPLGITAYAADEAGIPAYAMEGSR